MEPTYVAFVASRRVASGDLDTMLRVLKKRFDRDPAESVLVFDEVSGRQIDFDLRGTLDEVLQRASPSVPRGPGRPRLGVTSREVSLLPRHWAWLEAQPNGISAALRRLVDKASKEDAGDAEAARIRASLSYILTAIAGNLRNYEQASRALFAGDLVGFETHIAKWPKDIRNYASQRAQLAARAGA